MSNFLDKFEGKNYEELEDEKLSEKNPAVEEQHLGEKKPIPNIESEDILSESKASREEVIFNAVEIDTSYRKKKRLKMLAIVASSATLVLVASIGFYFSQLVTLPNFEGKPLADATKWSVSKKVKVEKVEAFSTEFDEGTIIAQKEKPQSKIKKKQTFEVTVSKGADPDEKLVLPDFSKMSEGLIKSWIEKNKASNLKIVSEFNEEKQKGAFLKTEFKSGDVNHKNYRRKDYGIIYVSKGKEVFEKNIEMLDFKGKMQGEVEAWAKEKDVEVTFNEVDSRDDDIGQIVSQSIAPKEKIARKDKLSFDVSIGKAAIVPWFGDMLKSDASSYNEDGLMVKVKEQYHPSVEYGKVISQSVASGTRLTGTDKEVTVYYSLGKPYLNELAGMSENQLAPYFYEFREAGVEIGYTVHYEKNADVPKGTVIRASRGPGYFTTGAHIDIYVSN